MPNMPNMYRYEIEVSLTNCESPTQEQTIINCHVNPSDCTTSTCKSIEFECESTIHALHEQFGTLLTPATPEIHSATATSDSTVAQDQDESSHKNRPLLVYHVKSLEIMQYQETIGQNHNFDHSESTSHRVSRRSSCATTTPTLAINIPTNVLSWIDSSGSSSDNGNNNNNNNHNNAHEDSNENIQQESSSSTMETPSSNSLHRDVDVLSDFLPNIHPSLAYFDPCILLNSNRNNTSTLDSTRIPKNATQPSSSNNNDLSSSRRHNSFAILLLKPKKQVFGKLGPMKTFKSDSSSDSCPNTPANESFFNQILDEINGEPMGISQSSVIQALPISKIKVVHPETKMMIVKTKTSTPLRTNDDDTERIQRRQTRVIIPSCPVCRFRIEPRRLLFGYQFEDSLKSNPKCCTHATKHGVTTSTTEASSRCINIQFLSPWTYPNHCVACHILEERLTCSGHQQTYLTNHTSHHHHQQQHNNNTTRLHCFECHMKETLWVCLTCGVVGCGRYSHGHAESHYNQTSHPFSLELATQRIWDYASSSFVNRDDLLECTHMQETLSVINRVAYFNSSASSSGSNGTSTHTSNAENDDYCQAHNGRSSPNTSNPYNSLDAIMKPKKAAVVGEEYQILLQSALEDQAQHFDLEIAHLTAQLASELADKEQASDQQMNEIQVLEKEITDLKNDIEVLSRDYIHVQAEEVNLRAQSNSLLREQSVTKQLKEKIRADIAREHEEGRQEVEELEQQISDLEANIRMRRQIAKDEELSNAQIYGTVEKMTTKPASSNKKKGRRKSRR